MSKLIFVILSTMTVNCFGQTQNLNGECNGKYNLTMAINEVLFNRDTVDSLFEFVLFDYNLNRTILDAYGFKTSIKKHNECNFSFYLEASNIKALKYDMHLYKDYYIIQLDSSFNPYKNSLNYNIDLIEKVISLYLYETKIGENSTFQDQIFILFKASMNGHAKALEVFENIKKEINSSFLGYEYLVMERILIDHGYIKCKNSTADKPRIYKVKYSY